MHNLVIDIGNTNIKIAVFKKRELVHFESVRELDQRRIAEIVETYKITHTAVSNVSSDHEEIAAYLSARTHFVEFSVRNHAGIKNYYESASTLGLDRWAKVIAVHQLYASEDCFIIDAGTCITYDFLNSRSEYYGGSISLGINMRFEALHHFTGRLPLVKWDQEKKEVPFGSDTNNAILNGVLQGVINEVTGFITSQYNKNNKVRIVVTGGDAAFLIEKLKDCTFAPQLIQEPYLVLKGLNEVIAFEYVQKN